MWVYSDGKLIRTFNISLGAAQTPTYLGTAVVISKANPQLMVSSPGEAYYSIEVPWSVRVTYDGEFLHDAYWNSQLGQANLSHGCTNLAPADAEWYYTWSAAALVGGAGEVPVPLTVPHGQHLRGAGVGPGPARLDHSGVSSSVSARPDR